MFLYALIISSLTILWTLILVPFIYFGFSFYCITNANLVITISKNIKYATICNEDNEPSGLFFGFNPSETTNNFFHRYYIGYIVEGTSKKDSSMALYCLAHPSVFLLLKKKEDDVKKPDDQTINLLVREGNYYCLRYKERELICTHFIPTEKQTLIINQIMDHYTQHQICVGLVCGSPGSGKTALGTLLAKQLSGSLCKTYRPTDPGDSLENIYNKANPTSKNPLIILLDEFDIILDLFHNNKIKLHTEMHTEVSSKISWNTLLDDIQSKLYPFMIVILTSNLERETLETEYDPSYIRPGRVHVYAQC